MWSQSLLNEVFFPTYGKEVLIQMLESQSLLNEVFFPTEHGIKKFTVVDVSQSLLNEVFFPTPALWLGWIYGASVSQSLLNEVFFPTKRRC